MLYWEQVPGFFDFHEVYDEAVATAPSNAVLVEVGTLFGRSALYMAEQIKKAQRFDISFYCVDRWDLWPDIIWHEDTAYSAVIREHGSLFQAFAYFLEQSGLTQFVKILRMTSLQAAEVMYGRGANFVFIDADHRYENCKADIMAWKEVIKSRYHGTIAGHDYQLFPDVAKAAKEVFGVVHERPPNSWSVYL